VCACACACARAPHFSSAHKNSWKGV